ncbi:MAG: hypothetical protein KatS3mg078_1572 [Deltaproteobacteria bacterium]|nr:MAG: hypothetical protein KatS3mg078_1572 [Deltaproteobacteria bacterium]
MEKKKKILKIKWQRLVSEGETCPRCGSTEKELDKAILILKQFLALLGIEVELEKEELSLSEFEKEPLQSNRIWINNLPIEDYIGGKIGQNPCCGVCGPHECRTVEIEGRTYETIPSEIIVKAGLFAAYNWLEQEMGGCCVDSRD